jgi:DNA-binding GntR family transcriptional regulator
MEKIKFVTKSDLVYQALKNDILSGKYKPEQRIITSEVAKRFGLSESPVREALKHLESEGLIQNTPHVGAIITSLDMADVEKIYQVRINLEGLATRLAVQNIDKRGLGLLDKLIVKMEKFVRNREYEKLGLCNKEFHATIYSACGNEYLYKIIFELWDLSFRTPGVFAFVPERAKRSLLEHKKILSALRKRDGNLAEKLVIEQKKRSLNALRLFFEETGNKEERLAL